MHEREKALVVRALIELVDGVDVSHAGEVIEDDLIGADADDRAVLLEQRVDSLALLETEDVVGDPEVGDGSVPRARDGAEG